MEFVGSIYCRQKFDLTDIAADIIGHMRPRVRENTKKKNY